MNVEVVDNVSRNMISVLLPAIEQSKDTRIAVAFVSQRGLSMIEMPTKAVLKAGGSIEYLIGLDMRTTEPEALKYLYELSVSNPGVSIYCYASLESGTIYHPKLYLFKMDDHVKSIIGSSNLTVGGLQKNIEVNILIEAGVQEEIISDIYNTYNRLKFHPKRVIPDAEFLTLYADLCDLEKKQQLKVKSDKLSQESIKAFNDKVRTLRHPIPTVKDLVGWPKLEYDFLPVGEFTNQEVYRHENVFRKHYPGNLNIKAKIRQQLQILRNLGLIEHLSTAKWRKL